MIRASLDFASGGILSSCRVTGHACFISQDEIKPGENVLCAAVSVLLRTAARTLEQHPEIRISGEAPDPGNFWFKIESWPPEQKGWLKGLSDFLVTGFSDLKEEYPEMIELIIKG